MHGIAEWEPEETHVAWREEVGVVTGDLLNRYSPRDLLEAYPLKPRELLRDRTERLFEKLQALAERHPNAPVWVVNQEGGVAPSALARLADPSATSASIKRPLIARMAGQTVLLPPTVGRLGRGMLDGTSESSGRLPSGRGVW